MDIIARKPRQNDGEFIVVDRGEGIHMRYVSATANLHSLQSGEWFWGHYFATREEAMAHFNSR